MFEFKCEVEVEDRDSGREGKCEIKWGVEFELRSWGMKSVIPYVRDQDFTGWLEKIDDSKEGYEVERDAQTFMIKDVNVEDAEIKNGFLCPQLLVIEDKEFSVYF